MNLIQKKNALITCIVLASSCSVRWMMICFLMFCTVSIERYFIRLKAGIFVFKITLKHFQIILGPVTTTFHNKTNNFRGDLIPCIGYNKNTVSDYFADMAAEMPATAKPDETTDVKANRKGHTSIKRKFDCFESDVSHLASANTCFYQWIYFQK